MAARRVVAQARYILASVAENKNKYWGILQYEDGEIVTEWGRVGAKLTTSSLGQVPNASDIFRRRCAEKQTKGYAPLQVIYDGGATPGVAASAASIAITAARDILGSASSVAAADAGTVALERLVKLLAAQNVHDVAVATGGQIFDGGDGLFRTPLGVVTDGALTDARALLNQMAPLVAAQDFASPAWSELLSRYLTLIPRDIGQRRPDPARLFPDSAALQREATLLDSLAGSIQVLEARRAQAIALAASPEGGSGVVAAPPRIFDINLRLVAVGEEEDPAAPSTAGALWPPGSVGAQGAPTTGEVFKNLRSLFHATAKGPRAHAAAAQRLRRVYSLTHLPMAAAFSNLSDPRSGASVGNVMRLWHGTRVGNLLSILRKGLVVPPASSPHVTGRMFGDGIYASDCSTKVSSMTASVEGQLSPS